MAIYYSTRLSIGLPGLVLHTRNEVDSIPTFDLETPIRDKSIPHFSKIDHLLIYPNFRPRNADSGHIYTSFFKNRSFTNLLGVNEVNDLFLKIEV